MTHRLTPWLALGALLLAAVPVAGHHAVQAQFAFDTPMELKGTLGKIEWVNPHAYIYLDVKDEKTGEVARWGFETIGPGNLRRAGFSRGPNAFKVGDPYTFVGFPARDGNNQAFLTAVLFPDGRKVTIWFGDPFAR